MIKKLTAEFFGTLFLTFSILSSITTTGRTYDQIIWTHGFAIFILATTFGQISGGHFNPAVSLAMIFGEKNSGKLSVGEFFMYFMAQLVGGFLAGVLNYTMFNGNAHYSGVTGDANTFVGPLGNYPLNDQNLCGALLCEILGTALLVLAIKMTSSKRNAFIAKMQEKFPIFDIFFISAMITFIGFMGILYYAGINPAREFGPRMAGWALYGARALEGEYLKYMWVPIVGPFVGSIVGVLGFMGIEKLYETDEKIVDEKEEEVALNA